jgi:NAD(P)-dependent dehydrogenase (short-subunit alcohol dehydrogenase family)
MATRREYGGFHIDTVTRVIRKTLLNECLTLPIAAAVTWLSRPSSAIYLRQILDFAARYSINITSLNLTQLARTALYLGGTGLLISANNFLTKWAFNNFTASLPGEWDWEREIVVVTGGSSGLGAEVIKGLLARNPLTQIIIIDFVPLRWTPPAGMLGANLHYYQADLSKSDVIRDVCARVRAEVGHPTVLFNNAGIVRGFSILEAEYADIEVTHKTNLTAPFLLVKEFLPDMVRNNHGHIVSVCSASAIVPPPDIVDYAATKAGIQALYEGLGMELRYRYNAPRVRLTNGVFNFIRTPMVGGQPSQPQFLLPILHVETVSEAIVDQLYSGYGGVMYLPGLVKHLATMVRLLDLVFNQLLLITLIAERRPAVALSPALEHDRPLERSIQRRSAD